MTYVVYHKTLLPEIIKDEDYFNYLETNEWFDRPQTETRKGNSDETKRILERRTEESKSRLLQRDGHGEQILRDRHPEERVHQASGICENNGTNETSAQVEEVKKKRGRRPKERG
jgi:hypothetical protein